jgi:hypothetical protein
MHTHDPIYVRFLEPASIPMVAREGLPFGRVGPDGKVVKASAVLSEQTPWGEMDFQAGDELRGWVLGCLNGAIWLFLYGSADCALVPRDKVEVRMRGDNPTLDARVSPRKTSLRPRPRPGRGLTLTERTDTWLCLLPKLMSTK